MNEIINSKDLKTDYWHKVSKNKIPELDYDSEVDTLYIYFAPFDSKDRIIYHFVDQYVAFLFRSSDNEVVGMAFEYFMRGYMPKYNNQTWMLSKTNTQLNGIKDFLFRVELKDVPHTEKLYTIPKPIERRVQAEPVFA